MISCLTHLYTFLTFLASQQSSGFFIFSLFLFLASSSVLFFFLFSLPVYREDRQVTLNTVSLVFFLTIYSGFSFFLGFGMLIFSLQYAIQWESACKVTIHVNIEWWNGPDWPVINRNDPLKLYNGNTCWILSTWLWCLS